MGLAVILFNGDCCWDDFYNKDLDKVKECVEFWLEWYEIQDFVRWSIFDKENGYPMGTIKICSSLKYAADGKRRGYVH